MYVHTVHNYRITSYYMRPRNLCNLAPKKAILNVCEFHLYGFTWEYCYLTVDINYANYICVISVSLA